MFIDMACKFLFKKKSLKFSIFSNFGNPDNAILNHESHSSKKISSIFISFLFKE